MPAEASCKRALDLHVALPDCLAGKTIDLSEESHA
jgi:hypothetical protein